MIFQYKNLYYIPAIYIVSVILRRFSDETFYINTWYPIVITFSFVIAGIITRPIKQKLEEKYKTPVKNSITYLSFFFAFWFFFIYDLPHIHHMLNSKKTTVGATITHINSYMSSHGQRYNYRRHQKVTIDSENKIFDKEIIHALDNEKYMYLRTQDKIKLNGEMSPFMFKLKSVDLIVSPLTEKEKRHSPIPPNILN